jgi:F-type H+-transporting ATPase subunit epsilon
MAFQCVVVTPEQQVLSDSAQSAVITAHDGELGILTNRAPLLVKLGIGPMRVTTAKGQAPRVFLVEGGIAQMQDNRLTVLTTRAIPAEQINAEAAQTELTEALARPAGDARAAEERLNAIRRAQARIRIAAR